MHPIHHALRSADTTASSDGDETSSVPCDEFGGLCETLYDLTDNETVAEVTTWLLGTPIKLLLIVVIALLLNRLVRRWIGRIVARLGRATSEHGQAVVGERARERAEERASTIGSLLRSLSTAIIFGVALVMILETLGVGIMAIIASAGILGLAIGFGAQSVVEDLLRGVFMLVEDQFGVGDRVDVGAVNGYVERVTLRTTVIRAPDGTLWHVPNSEINWVANENQLHSRAAVTMGVSYDCDLGEAMQVLGDAARATVDEPEWRDHVDGEPQVQGVQELGDDAVKIRVIVWVDAGGASAVRARAATPPEGGARPGRHHDAEPSGRRLRPRADRRLTVCGHRAAIAALGSTGPPSDDEHYRDAACVPRLSGRVVLITGVGGGIGGPRRSRQRPRARSSPDSTSTGRPSSRSHATSCPRAAR